MSKELEAKLEQALKDQDASNDTFRTEIASLRQQIMDAQKPKLRHGDMYGNDRYCVTILSHNARWRIIHKDGSHHHDTAVAIAREIQDLTYLGNIFDDLKAMQEEVTEFEHDDTVFKLEGGRIRIEMNHKQVWYIDLTPKFSLQVRQMEATMKRKK